MTGLHITSEDALSECERRNWLVLACVQRSIYMIECFEKIEAFR